MIEITAIMIVNIRFVSIGIELVVPDSVGVGSGTNCRLPIG